LSQRVYENADVALGIKGAELVSSPITYSPHPIWIYFLAGALFVLFLYSIINWRKL
jgi:hypothetical protein